MPIKMLLQVLILLLQKGHLDGLLFSLALIISLFSSPFPPILPSVLPPRRHPPPPVPHAATLFCRPAPFRNADKFASNAEMKFYILMKEIRRVTISNEDGKGSAKMTMAETCTGFGRRITVQTVFPVVGQSEVLYMNDKVQNKGGSTQVRFQPRVGQFLVTASGTVVSLFDVETDRRMHTFQGHSAEVHCVCWDTNGDCLASVSQESVKVWSLASGECIHELNSSGNMYHSCVLHPSYSTLLVSEALLFAIPFHFFYCLFVLYI
ncbi:hypothetical protein VNO80_25200 [Phaseolus coccineus]|uniref:Uncharacterized protein n=1 Tax=Phaseolus coccineus TaxID=3886 RepID=A0AAN9LTU8_PHACN